MNRDICKTFLYEKYRSSVDSRVLTLFMFLVYYLSMRIRINNLLGLIISLRKDGDLARVCLQK